jgi:hypothetical protein
MPPSDSTLISHVARIGSIEYVPQVETVTPFGWLVIHTTVGTLAVGAITLLLILGVI